MTRIMQEIIVQIFLITILICSTKADGVNDVIIDGSDIELSFGVVYAIKSISSGRYLDGRAGERDPLMKDSDNLNGDRFIHWTIVQSDHGYALRSVSSGRYLDGRNGEIEPYMTYKESASDFNRFLSFTFEATNGKLNDVYPRIAIKGVASGRYLDGRAGEINPVMTARDPTDDRFLQWIFVPINYKLKAVVLDFDFGNIEEQLNSEKSLAFIESKTIVARATGISVEGEFSRSIEESFSFGFEQTVGIGVETEVSAGIPLLAGGSTTISASFEFSANQQKTKTRTSEYSQSYSFEPQEIGVYEVGIKVYEDTNARLPFTSKVLISGTSNDGTKIYTGEELQGIIYYGGFNCKVVAVYGEFVEAVMMGTLRASFAVSSEIYNQRVGDIPENE